MSSDDGNSFPISISEYRLRCTDEYPLILGAENHHNTINKLAKEINGKHLIVATVINKPMSAAQPDPQNNGNLIGSGVAFFVMDILRDKFNFTYEVILAKKNVIMGGSDPEDSLIGLVTAGKVDMAAAFVPYILELQQLVSFSIPLEEETWLMILKRPSESAVGEGLLAPFNKLVWFLILVAVVTFGPCIYVLTHIRAKLITDDELPLSLYRSVWFVYGALFKQGTNLSPKANTTRVLFTTWWLFIMLLSAFYMANLTAFLTLSQFTLEIQGPQDLLKKNYPWVAASGGVVEYAVTKPTGNMFYLNEMVKKKRAEFQPYTSINDFFNQVEKEVVLIKSGTTVRHGLYQNYLNKTREGVPETQRCTYVVAPTPFTRNMRGFIYPKNSTLKILFDMVLGIIIQSGVVEELKNRQIPKVKICPMNLQLKDRQLQNTDLVMTYKISIAGVCVAVAAFTVEIIYKRYITATCKPRIKTKIIKKLRCNYSTDHIHSTNDESPPPYDTIFGKPSKIKLPKGAHKKVINGREYLVLVGSTREDIRLVPIRAPSALLYRVGK